MVKVFEDRACVLHGHPQKEGSKTDKPMGTTMKCYYFSVHGKAEAIKKAEAMHYAIQMSQKKEASK